MFSSFVCAQLLLRELLLLTGISNHGLGNWKKIAELIGTRTKEEVEEHYNSVYVESPEWPLPVSARAQDREYPAFIDKPAYKSHF